VFGLSTHTPIIGDWDGDGVDDIGAHRGDLFMLDANTSGSNSSDEQKGQALLC
jgi:hypothetical protein